MRNFGTGERRLTSLRLFLALALMAIGGLAVAPPSSAVPASPAALTMDCDQVNGAVGTTITGRIGDTFTVTNAATTNGCTFATYAGIVTATNLTGDVLAAGGTTTLSIVAAGTFTITPNASGGVAATMTVAIGDPRLVPEWLITFDANGGTCSTNPLTVTALSGEWYELPTEGTGSFQCQRADYRLVGWSHGSTVFTPGRGEQAPDVPLTTSSASPPSNSTSPIPDGATVTPKPQARAEEHVTLYADWLPLGTEITFDANVGADDECLDANGADLAVPDRSTEATVFYAGAGDTLLAQPPCAPTLPNGAQYTFTGWALTGSGATAFSPGAPLAQTGLPIGASPTLYATWRPPSVPTRLLEVDENYSISIGADPGDLTKLRIAFQLRNGANGWMGLVFNEFMFPADGIFVWYDETSESCNVWDAYNPGIPTLSNFPSPLKDNDPLIKVYPANGLDNQENVEVIDCLAQDGTIEITVERALDTGDILDFPLEAGDMIRVLAQYNDRQIFINEFGVVQPMYTNQKVFALDL